MVDINVHAHVIGGMLYLIPATFMARVCYCRLYEMATSGKSNNSFSVNDYGNQYFPEPSPLILKGIGIYFTSASILGYMILTITEVPEGMSLFEDTFHMMLYALYGSTGLIHILEGYSQVPHESARVTFAMALAFETLLVYVHSHMKDTEKSQWQHQFIALTTGIGSVAMFLSVKYKDWLLPYVVFVASFIWQALWWITIGICFLPAFEELDYGDICVYFSLEGMFLFFVVLTLATKLENASGGGVSTGDSKPNYERAALVLENNTDTSEVDEEM